MIPSKNLSVEGVVWRELTDKDFANLDRYEGCHVAAPVYQREKREVIIDGKTEEVWTYFGTSAFIISIREESDEPNVG